MILLGRWGARSPLTLRDAELGVDSLILSFRAMFDPRLASWYMAYLGATSTTTPASVPLRTVVSYMGCNTVAVCRDHPLSRATFLLGPKEHAVCQVSFAKPSVRSMTRRRSASSIQAIVEHSPPTLTTEMEPCSG